jgi:AcrR family transcriptional regulator
MSITLPNPTELPTRERLLWAALTCFSQKGYHQTTTDEIVAESGLGKGTLYRHFGTKKELFISLAGWMFEQMGRLMAGVDGGGLSAADQLRAIVTSLAADTEQLLPFYRITLDYWSHTIEDEEVRLMFKEALAQFQQRIAPVIEAGIAGGEFRAVDAGQATAGLFAALDGLGLYKALLLDDFDLTAAVDTLLDIYLAGLQRV